MSGWSLTVARAVSPSGRSIIGTGWAPDGRMQAWIVRIPEFTTSGDLNCDGEVTFFDIDPFVVALGGEAAYYAVYPDCIWSLADTDCDGDVDFFDIDPFVAKLGCPGSDPVGCGQGCPWQVVDMDFNVAVDFFDIDPFVARLGAQCP